MTDGLILYLPLTEPLDAGPIDRSEKHHHVNVVGTPRLHSDRKLGAAHRFSGEEKLHIPKFGIHGEGLMFTIQVWVMPHNDVPCNLLALGNGSFDNTLFWTCQPDGTLTLEIKGGEFPQALTPGEWTHLTIHCDGYLIHTWINGVRHDTVLRRPGFALEESHLQVGAGIDRDFGLFVGSMAQLQVFDRVLTPIEIEERFLAGLKLRAAFVESHPIRLSLLDANDDAVIYMSDHASGEPLTLEFFNLAGRAIFFDKLSGVPGPNNHHFELRFRPGTLHRSTMTRGKNQMRLADESDWLLSDPLPNANGTTSFFLICKTPKDLICKTPKDASVTLDSERAMRVELTNVRADPAAGARTGRVEMLYAHIHLGGKKQRLLHGATVSQFSILSHIGRSHLPLHTCFIGGNTIIPGTSIDDNKLALRLTNLESELPIPWQPGQDPWDDDKRVSYFEIGFDYEDTSEDKPWALCRTDEAVKMQINGVNGSDMQQWQAQASPEGEPRAWRIYSGSAPHLDRGQHIEVTLSGLGTTLPSGTTNLYLRYANIPGYQAGQVVMTVEKSHLVVREDKVGIGTNTPTSPLHIASENGLTVGDTERFIKVLRDMIEMQDQHSQVYFLPQSLTLRDRKNTNERSDLRPSGLTLHAEGERLTLEPERLTVGDRKKYVKIGRSIELEDGAGNTILHPQSLTFRDSDDVNKSSSLRLRGLELYNEDGTTKLDSDGLTIADKK